METLFEESLRKHQEIIDVILKCKAEDGLCYISKDDIVSNLEGRQSTSWLNLSIKQINFEGIILQEVGRGVFKVIHENLLEYGIFNSIAKILIDVGHNPEYIRKGDFELMEIYGVSRKVIQKARAYILSGWKEKMLKGTKNS